MESLLNKRALTALLAGAFLGLTLVSCGEKTAETATETPAAEAAPAPAPAADAVAPATTAEAAQQVMKKKL